MQENLITPLTLFLKKQCFLENLFGLIFKTINVRLPGTAWIRLALVPDSFQGVGEGQETGLLYYTS